LSNAEVIYKLLQVDEKQKALGGRLEIPTLENFHKAYRQQNEDGEMFDSDSESDDPVNDGKSVAGRSRMRRSQNARSARSLKSRKSHKSGRSRQSRMSRRSSGSLRGSQDREHPFDKVFSREVNDKL